MATPNTLPLQMEALLSWPLPRSSVTCHWAQIHGEDGLRDNFVMLVPLTGDPVIDMAGFCL